MAIVFPTITPSVSPVTITSQTSTVTWSQINQSITSGAYRLKLNTIYIDCQDITQLNENFYFFKYSQSGYEAIDVDGVNIDPNQIQPTAFWDVSKSDIIIDNMAKINYQLNPNETVQLAIFAKYITNMDAMERELGNNGNFVIPPKKQQFFPALHPDNSIKYLQIKDSNKNNELIGIAAIVGGAILLLKIIK